MNPNKSGGSCSIIIVAYNHRHFLADCLQTLERAIPHDGSIAVFLVDNASTDGTQEFVRKELLREDGQATKGGLPLLFMANEKNLGFSGGNNLAIELALRRGDEFVYLLNPDTEVEPGFLEKAISVMRQDESIGIVQSLLRLYPQKELVNSWGNELHFLGFGYAGGEGVAVDSREATAKLTVHDIAYASGAGMLIRTSLIRKIGLLNEELFAYHEDLEYSWRARLAGYRVMLAPASVVYHKYEFSRSIQKFYLMERNRFLVMSWCFSFPTLALIAPAFILMELGLWIFAFKSGWWQKKAQAYGYFLSPRSWGKIWRTRVAVQKLRSVSDREATKFFTGKILFQQMQPALLTKVANPLFDAYWKCLYWTLWW